MQKAEIVLSMLGQKSSGKENHGYVFDRLYRNLFNPDFYVYAYAQLFPKRQCLLKKSLKMPLSFESTVKSIIEKIKKETFWPQPLLKTADLSGYNFEDRLVKAVLSFILEALYPDLSQGYCLDRHFKAHKILSQIQATCQNKDWVITGNINNFLDNIDYETINKLLTKKIADGRFLELIKRFINAGHLKYEQNSDSGLSSLIDRRQGGLSGIIADIYLNEFDLFIDKLRLSAGNSINFFRFLNHFVIFTALGRASAEIILEKISLHLKTNLKLDLDGEKTAIARLSNGQVNFLGYEITKPQSKYISAKSGISKITPGTIELLVPNEIIAKKLKQFSKNNKPAPHFARINLPVSKIIALYNSEIRELYDYYRLASNLNKKIGKFKFYHYYSLAKTIACKEKISVRKVMEKYGIEVKTKNGSGVKKVIGVPGQLLENQLTYFLPDPP